MFLNLLVINIFSLLDLFTTYSDALPQSQKELNRTEILHSVALP